MYFTKPGGAKQISHLTYLNKEFHQFFRFQRQRQLYMLEKFK